MNSESIAACAPPYSVVQSVNAPDRQMVVVPATSTSATTAIAKVSFTVLPFGERRYGRERFGGAMLTRPAWPWGFSLTRSQTRTHNA